MDYTLERTQEALIELQRQSVVVSNSLKTSTYQNKTYRLYKYNFSLSEINQILGHG